MIFLNHIISLTYIITQIILLIILCNKKRYIYHNLIWVLLYVIISVFVFFLLAIFRDVGLINFSITTYSILEFLIFGQLLDGFLNHKKKVLITAIRFIYTIIIISYLCLNNAYKEDNLWAASFPSLFIIFQCLFTMNIILKNEKVDHFKKISFWATISVFFLNIFSIPIDIYDYYLFDYIFQDSALITAISHYSIYIFFNIILINSIHSLC